MDRPVYEYNQDCMQTNYFLGPMYLSTILTRLRLIVRPTSGKDRRETVFRRVSGAQTAVVGNAQ